MVSRFISSEIPLAACCSFSSVHSLADGVALLAAVVNELTQRGKDCPKTLLTTHFMEALALLQQTPQVRDCRQLCH